MENEEIENIERKLILQAIKLRYEYDFTDYASSSINRRVEKALRKIKYKNISDVISKILYDEIFFSSFFLTLSVNVTEMFRDPDYFLEFRKKIVPYLSTYPFFKIWIAGCSTGEEAYSIAIILKEENIYDRALIYATDFNDKVLQIASSGIYKKKDIKEIKNRYKQAGGVSKFEDYFISDKDNIIMKKSLKKNIVFANHNLTTDSSFGEVNMIACRNVMIYFTEKLKNRVFGIFDESLKHNGFLSLGKSESLMFSNISKKYNTFNANIKLYQKRMD